MPFRLTACKPASAMITRAFSACLNPDPLRSSSTAWPPAICTECREEELAQPVSQRTVSRKLERALQEACIRNTIIQESREGQREIFSQRVGECGDGRQKWQGISANTEIFMKRSLR